MPRSARALLYLRARKLSSSICLHAGCAPPPSLMQTVHACVSLLLGSSFLLVLSLMCALRCSPDWICPQDKALLRVLSPMPSTSFGTCSLTAVPQMRFFTQFAMSASPGLPCEVKGHVCVSQSPSPCLHGCCASPCDLPLKFPLTLSRRHVRHAV